MSAFAGITTDYKIAMLAKESEKVQTLRLILNAMKNEEIQKGPGKELTQDEVTVVLKRLVKSRQDSIEAFTQVGAKERAEAEAREIEVIQIYLPRQLTEEELKVAVNEAIAKVQPTGVKQMGLVLKALKEAHGNSFDGRLASTLVSGLLQ